MAYIYCIENLINNKKYVGETTYSIQIRWKEHQRASRSLKNAHRPLYKAIQKYGIDNFIVYQLEECDNNKRWEREQYWIKTMNSFHQGYNATIGRDGSSSIEWNEEDFIELYSQKESPQYIADYFNCCVDSVTKYAHSLNLSLRGWKQRHDIIAMDQDGNYIKSFYSAGDAAQWIIDNNISKANLESIRINIMRCCKGSRKTAYKITWKFL